MKKKIIDGKLYNTETADLVAEWHNGLGSGDFNSRSEELYLTKKGAWFLHGEGGALTRWSKSNGNSSWGSSNIVPLSADEAREWLEQHDCTEELETHFKDEIEEA